LARAKAPPPKDGDFQRSDGYIFGLGFGNLCRSGPIVVEIT